MFAKRSENWTDLNHQHDPHTPGADRQAYRRIDKRIDYKAEVIFSVAAKIVTGKIRNISIGGAAIQSLDLPAIGDNLIVSIPFTNQQKNIRRKAVVRWVSGEVFGVKFI